jgi:hypothetical protein
LFFFQGNATRDAPDLSKPKPKLMSFNILDDEEGTVLETISVRPVFANFTESDNDRVTEVTSEDSEQTTLLAASGQLDSRF